MCPRSSTSPSRWSPPGPSPCISNSFSASAYRGGDRFIKQRATMLPYDQRSKVSVAASRAISSSSSARAVRPAIADIALSRYSCREWPGRSFTALL
eukprot:scaffold63121_cov69-Phaeocystis_antarctica.AAC.3